ncbi:sulfite exporter TauE/SafE family protein [Cesiribacter sp. SM1]|uniref:sulfite exporter TauE/SafE family protein n=1 Tax=Cesiribacter sp. SM1 TaxID=2861196 RepID=UPI001CD7588A|nr:sulfite exporter TauE/SafE family protein [Cesiribacter sp. SM1]
MQFWSAVLIGFLGSMHCVAMCGPLALAVPAGKTSAAWLQGRLLYQAGRLLTYAALGAVVGALGQSIALAGWQQGLSVAGGILLLLFALSPSRVERFVGGAGFFGKPLYRLKQSMAAVLRRRYKLSGFLLGLLNGLLPCGLVYLGLAGALVTGSAVTGATYMAAFGAGTLPAMLVVVVAGNWLRGGWQLQLRRLAPTAAFVMGLALVARGLELGIPYLSPVLAWVEKGIPVCGQQ